MDSANAFRNACAILMNLDLDVLVKAGVIKEGNIDNGGSSWRRLNNEPLMFILKLDDDRLDRLWTLIQSRQPKKYKEQQA